MLKKIIISALIFLGLSLYVNADEYEISKEIDSYLNDIKIENFSLSEFKNELLETKEIPDVVTIYDKIKKILFDEAYEALKSLIKLVIPIMLFGMLSPLSMSGNNDGVYKVAYICCYGIICSSIISVFYDISILAEETVTEVDVMTKSLIPVVFSLMLTVGKVFSFATMQPTIIFVSQIMIVIINNLLFPLTMLSFALSISDNLSDECRLSNFSVLLRKIVKWSIVFLLTVFTAILSAQNILSGSFDSVAVTSVKFAAVNFVPVIGGALAEGVETIGSSLMLIKNATGIAGVAGMIVIVFVPVIKIYLVSLMFHILSAISQPVTGEKFSKALTTAGETVSILGALVICMAFVFIISVAMILGGIT